MPRISASDNDIKIATARDLKLKKENDEMINSSKYKKQNKFNVEDTVLIRNIKPSNQV